MARVKISEFRAKTLLYDALGISYTGISLSASDALVQLKIPKEKSFVIKVDSGIKKRMKKGLVALDKNQSELKKELEQLARKGFSDFIIEPFIPHLQSSEKYFSLERTREGILVLYSTKGGVDIEENRKEIRRKLIRSNNDLTVIASELGLDQNILEKLLEAFEKYYFSFLEINPLVSEKNKIYFLDVAAEIDNSAEFFVKNAWGSFDFRSGVVKETTEEEKNIKELAAKSQASFALNVLNKNGRIFMLLSGGGASIVLADEVYNLGYGLELGNYGEYSGNPNNEEVYLYTKNLVSLLLKSKSKKKVLIIAGGVANFTDIRNTFKGVIRALMESEKELRAQGIKVYVRRGGPHQEEGLKMMEEFLEKNGILGKVAGPSLLLPQIISLAISNLTNEY